MKTFKTALLAAALSSAYGSTIFYSGDLRANATITNCGGVCMLAPSDSDATWAQWAGISIPFTLLTPTSVNAITFGFGGGTSATGSVVVAGGFEPYLSLFNSTGQFLMSTFNGINCPSGAGSAGGNCFDVKLDAGLLASGSYTLVLSAYSNMSLAENLGSGLLIDGLTGLGNLGVNENLNYGLDLNILAPVAATPEPGGASLLLCSAILMGWKLSARRRAASPIG